MPDGHCTGEAMCLKEFQSVVRRECSNHSHSMPQEGALPHLVHLLKPGRSDYQRSGVTLGPTTSSARPQDQAHAARIIALLSQVDESMCSFESSLTSLFDETVDLPLAMSCTLTTLISTMMQATPTHGHVSQQGVLSSLVEAAKSILFPPAAITEEEEEKSVASDGQMGAGQRAGSPGVDGANEGLKSDKGDVRRVVNPAVFLASFTGGKSSGFIGTSPPKGSSTASGGGGAWIQLQWWQSQKRLRERKDWIKQQHEAWTARGGSWSDGSSSEGGSIASGANGRMDASDQVVGGSSDIPPPQPPTCSNITPEWSLGFDDSGRMRRHGWSANKQKPLPVPLGTEEAAVLRHVASALSILAQVRSVNSFPLSLI